MIDWIARIIAILALIISCFALYYAKKQTNIMEQDLNLNKDKRKKEEDKEKKDLKKIQLETINRLKNIQFLNCITNEEQKELSLIINDIKLNFNSASNNLKKEFDGLNELLNLLLQLIGIRPEGSVKSVVYDRRLFPGYQHTRPETVYVNKNNNSINHNPSSFEINFAGSNPLLFQYYYITDFKPIIDEDIKTQIRIKIKDFIADFEQNNKLTLNQIIQNLEFQIEA